MRKLMLLAVLVLGTSFIANAETPLLKKANSKEISVKHPRKRKARKAKMAAAQNQQTASETTK
jgi:heme exporter protein D